MAWTHCEIIMRISHFFRRTRITLLFLLPAKFKFFVAPRSAANIRSNRTPRAQSAVPKKMLSTSPAVNPAATHSLELLEQLSLTREEWIEYFRTKKLPPKAEKELSRLTQPARVHENKIKLVENYAPLVTKL